MPSTRLLALLALSVGCSDAQYADSRQPDGGDVGEDSMVGASATHDGKAGEDATTPRDATSSGADTSLPPNTPWHAALKKHYAISTRFYAKDRGLADAPLFSHEMYTLATITIDGDKVTMEAKRCIDRGHVLALGLKDNFEWAHPQDVAAQTYELVMRTEGIRTEAPATPLGYRPERPAGCVDGQQLKVPDRAWFANGVCDCRSEPLPMFATDCRIVDDDGDGRPGITVNHKGVFNDPENMRTLDASQIVNGQLDSDGRMRASFVQSYESLPLVCCTSQCNRADLAPCALELNPVLFEPLADQEWTCDAMIEQMNAGKLFALPLLSFVNGC